ncbi:MAG: tannase/feruloyl esterase family alpha/beta hydrolase [Gammaproteobacteria bacterium]|jgi:feruloyl esterase|nr:tannase/feruloyl esterase family alpha/beta hydrolase [Gammaproteobacteria bacterium]
MPCQKIARWSAVLCLFGYAPFLAAQQSPQACQDLIALDLPNVEISLTEVVEAGEFSEARGNFADLPEFCRIAATLTPSSDSDIKMELWLPTRDWNGKYLAVGNGAFTGNVRHAALSLPLSRGYATSSTDTGHLGNTASFGLGHPEKVIDFGWRAVHEMNVTSKALIAAYYDTGPRHAYFTGCSAGGRQAMKEAQRFPADFDGIVAGAPGADWTGRAAASLRIAAYLEANQSARLSSADRELVYSAAVAACDTDDGVQDGLIGRPAQCNFDPTVLQCSSGSATSCLTLQQINTVKMIYTSPVNPATGRPITGLLPGSEMGWTDLGWTNSARATGLDQYRYLVYSDENWTIDRFDFDSDIATAERVDDDTLNALDPDLKAFFDGGGKLISYHGWSDPQISPANATQYYESVVEAFGNRNAIHDSYRLFMVPGMGHCAGGPGPNSFDSLSVLEAWVEQGQAPDSIIAVHRNNGEVDRSRPLCPYPEVAGYTGSGSSDEAASFECRAP